MLAWASVYVFMLKMYQNIKKSATKSKFHVIAASKTDLKYSFCEVNYINVIIKCIATQLYIAIGF